MPPSEKGGMSASPLMWTADRPPTVFVRGQGSWLTDKEGNNYLDFVQRWAVNCLGHSHPALVKAYRNRPEDSSMPVPPTSRTDSWNWPGRSSTIRR